MDAGTRTRTAGQGQLGDLVRARRATFASFLLNGFVLGMWVVHIPSIERRAGVSHVVLGYLLLALGLGAFAGMQIAGPLTDRLGARRVVPVSGVLCSLGVIAPAFAVNAWTLGVALVAFGLGNGCLDVSMNTHAVQVEAGYGRPVMSAFHAVFSIGGFFAALVGAGTLAAGVGTGDTLTAVAVVGVVVSLALRPYLLPAARRPDPHTEPPLGADATPVRHRRFSRRIWSLAALAIALMLTEGVANDWSALAAREGLGVSPATAALAYGSFAAAMTIGRFLADGASARYGPAAILRYGCGVGAVALTVVVLSPWIALTLVGWALLGLGLSGAIPQLFSAAGHEDPAAAGANVSRVAGLGYLGMLAGPAAIGPLTHLVELRHTFVLPALLCVAVTVFAGAAAPRDDVSTPG